MNRSPIALILFTLLAVPAAAAISGYSTASNCGEAGNWLDITFTADEAVTLTAASWDFSETGVWLDPNGSSFCGTVNDGLASVELVLDGDAGQPTQVFGIVATGFDSGDRYRFAVDLDVGGGGSPFTMHYLGGELQVEFSDGTILHGVFDTAYDEPNGARAAFAEAGPNLTFADRPGWYAPVVPRGDAGAAWTSVGRRRRSWAMPRRPGSTPSATTTATSPPRHPPRSCRSTVRRSASTTSGRSRPGPTTAG
ncbi:MAG: hypothetical protein R3D98_10970 [Candidatus Krumholzibacteriia bacterium]